MDEATDANNLDFRTDSSGFEHWKIKTSQKGEEEKSNLEFVGTKASNGNPARLWVFQRSTSFLGNMPMLQAALVLKSDAEK